MENYFNNHLTDIFEVTLNGIRQIFRVTKQCENLHIERLWCDHAGPIWPSFRPSDLSGLAKYYPSHMPVSTSVRWTTNEGMYEDHPALEVIQPIYVDIGSRMVVAKYDERRYRLDKALDYDYIVPTKLLPFMHYECQAECQPEWKLFIEPKAPEGYLPLMRTST